MKQNLPSVKLQLCVALLTAVVTGSAQTNQYPNASGNAANEIFSPAVHTQPAAFGNSNSLLSVNNSGMGVKTFSVDTNQLFSRSSSFRVSELSGWTYDGNKTYTDPGVKVGIGNSNPQYALDVNGSA